MQEHVESLEETMTTKRTRFVHGFLPYTHVSQHPQTSATHHHCGNPQGTSTTSPGESDHCRCCQHLSEFGLILVEGSTCRPCRCESCGMGGSDPKSGQVAHKNCQMLGTVIATSRQPNWRQTAFKRFQAPFIGGIPANHVVMQGWHEHPSRKWPSASLLPAPSSATRTWQLWPWHRHPTTTGHDFKIRNHLPFSHALAVNKPSPRAETTKATWAPCYERNGSTLINI